MDLGSGIEKIGIQDKRPGSETLVTCTVHANTYYSTTVAFVIFLAGSRSDAPVDPRVKNQDMDGNSLGTVTTVLNVEINVNMRDHRIPDVEPTFSYILLVLYSTM